MEMWLGKLVEGDCSVEDGQRGFEREREGKGSSRLDIVGILDEGAGLLCVCVWDRKKRHGVAKICEVCVSWEQGGCCFASWRE